MGLVGLDQKVAVPIMIRNTGGGPLTITGPVSVTPTNCTASVRDAAPPAVAPGGTGLAVVLVQAGTAGNPSVLVSIATNDGDENPFWQIRPREEPLAEALPIDRSATRTSS